MRRLLPVVMPGVLLLLFAPLLLVAPAALAAEPVVPGWVDEWSHFWDIWGPNGVQGAMLSGDGLVIMQPDYIRDSYANARPAPEGTDFETALKNGYTTFWADDGTGGKSLAYMHDVQSDIWNAQPPQNDAGFVSLKDAVKHQNAALAAADSRKLTATSSTLSKTMEATGLSAAEVESAAKGGTATQTKKLFETAAETAAGKGKPEAAALKTLAKKALPAAARVLNVVNTAGDVVMAEQFGVWAGNGIVGLFGIDDSGECDAVTNGFGRWALGISDKCNSLELQKQTVEAFSQSSITSHGLEAIGVTITGHHQHLDTYCGGTRDVYTATLTPSDTNRSRINFYVDGSSSATDVFDGPVVCAWSGWLKPGTTAAYAPSASGTVEFVGPSPAWLTSHTFTIPGYPDAKVSFETATTIAPVALTTDVTGSDGQHYTATGPTAPADQALTIPTVSLPDGVTPASVSLNVASDDSSKSKQVFSTPVTPADLSGKTLDLIQVTTGKSCYDLADACSAWASEVQQATGKAVTLSNTDTSTSTANLPYRCTWGGAEVAIGECTALARAFTSAALVTGETAADPKTGDEPVSDKPIEPARYDKFNLGSCIGSGVSWNPLSWVGVPVVCALKWAFQPDPLTVASLKADLDVKASTTVVNDVNTQFRQAVPTLPGSESCEGPVFNLSFLGYQVFPKDSHPLSVCPGTGLSFLPVVSKAGITAIAGLLALMVVRRRFSNAVGMQNEPAEGES